MSATKYLEGFKKEIRIKLENQEKLVTDFHMRNNSMGLPSLTANTYAIPTSRALI